MTKKVLIVDDEQNIVTALEYLLGQSGYQVEVAQNGEEALAVVDSFAPDLVLLDVMMPRVNGYEVCRRLRERPEWRHVKIVMLSAKGREVEVSKGISLGADLYVVKPFSNTELVAQIDALLAGA
ncbi:MAG: two-component system response regulator [Betaproteobacteria bacterium RIFCSPLOWO2_02_FULL_66_14]|nr:MAG: two-component system response regulator [Betaproteobacteria bacterium RIFCSPLOWO2_02_FULL_66_14]